MSIKHSEHGTAYDDTEPQLNPFLEMGKIVLLWVAFYAIMYAGGSIVMFLQVHGIIKFPSN